MTGIALAPAMVAPLPGAAAAAVAWRAQGKLHITVIAKATFAFAPGAPMPRTEPQEILRAEVHHGNNPGRSVRFTSDLAPALRRADVLFTGHAFAPTESPVSALSVRLAIFDGHRPILDKQLRVQASSAFLRMPVVYERAVMGPDGQDNPLGRAATAETPNILDPAEPRRPAGFGPIARAWPARKRLLGSVPRKTLEGPIVEIPEGFDWSYFQAAPPDQRIDFLRGDEWIILDGLHPSLPRLQTRLPGARGYARIYGLSAFGVSDGQLLELCADTLRIDGEERRCTVVWRQSFPIPGEAALAAAQIVAGVAIDGEELPFPDARASRGRLSMSGQDLEAPDTAALDSWYRAQPQAHEGTLSLSDEEIEIVGDDPGSQTVMLRSGAKDAASRPVIPFRPASSAGAEGLAHAAPRPREPLASSGTLTLGPVGGNDRSHRSPLPFETLAIPPDDERTAKSRPALPFLSPAPAGESAEPPSARSAALEPEERLSTGTLVLPPEASARLRSVSALPFVGAENPDPDDYAPTEKLYVKARHRDIAPPPRVTAPLAPPAPPPLIQPLQVKALAPTTAGSTAWRRGGERRITVMVKATFELRHEQPARLVDALPLSSEETAPYLPSAGVTLSGHARAPLGSPVPIMEVRLAIFRGTAALLEKTLHIYGDRGTTPSAPQAFEKMPLVYERAYGSASTPENPVGTGAGPRGGALPNILDPTDPHRTAGFGPVPRSWPARRRLLGDADVIALEAPIAEIPEVFDWQYFQAAPADQRIAFLRGDELIVLEGIHASIPRFETRLPAVQARAIRRVTTPRGTIEEEPIDLVADTLAIDADQGLCSVVWRGQFAVEEAVSLPHVSVIAGVETPDLRLTWPPSPHAAPVTVTAPAIAPLASASAPVPASAPEPPALETGLRATVLARLKARESLHGLDLAGADLRKLDFSGATLARLDLRGAHLEECTFTGARLIEAQLAEADLTGAVLSAADLSGADLSRAVVASARFDRATLSDANLSSARGAGASFEGATGRRVSFARASWDGASFADVELSTADFTGASLSGASFRGAALVDARFDNARSRGATFDGASMPRASAAGAALAASSFRDVDAPGSIWERAMLEDSIFEGAKLREANLTRAACHRASFAGADLGAANLQHLQGNSANLEGANLEGADLRNARLHEARFDGANLRKVAAQKADLSRSRFVRADLTESVLRGAKLKGARLTHARLDACNLLDADLENADVHGASLKTAKLNGANVKGLIDTDTDP